jgi:hypothetical protein
MNLEKLITVPALAIIAVAGITTFFGRRNTARVLDSAGKAFSGAISAALGKGVEIA